MEADGKGKEAISGFLWRHEQAEASEVMRTWHGYQIAEADMEVAWLISEKCFGAVMVLPSRWWPRELIVNPSFETVAKIVGAFGMRLSAQAA